MGLSTVALRRGLTARELELNQPAAPEIYRDMLPVTQSDTGLALNGDGPVVDWVLRMWRFPAEYELERVAERGALDDRLATAFGEASADYHAAAPVCSAQATISLRIFWRSWAVSLRSSSVQREPPGSRNGPVPPIFAGRDAGCLTHKR